MVTGSGIARQERTEKRKKRTEFSPKTTERTFPSVPAFLSSFSPSNHRLPAWLRQHAYASSRFETTKFRCDPDLLADLMTVDYPFPNFVVNMELVRTKQGRGLGAEREQGRKE